MIPPKYEEHDGTVKVSGRTQPSKAAASAFACLMRDKGPIEFLSIGANAGQQAVKAMWHFRQTVISSSQLADVDIAFIPFRRRVTSNQEGEDQERDVTVWRVMLLTGTHETPKSSRPDNSPDRGVQ